MKLEIFSVMDVATQMFGTPMFLVARGQALRSFTDEVNRPSADNMIYNHPDDFDLYYLGYFDTDTGRFLGDDQMERVMRGKDCKIVPADGDQLRLVK